MITPVNLQRKLKNVFTEPQAVVLSEVIHESYSNLAQTSDFNELKELVRQVVLAQVETGQQIKELAAAQNRTEQRVEELASTLQSTEQQVKELAIAQQEMTKAVQSVAKQVGALSDHFGGTIEDAAIGLVYLALTRDKGWKVEEIDNGWQSWDFVRNDIDNDWAVRSLVTEEIDFFGLLVDPERPNTKIWLIGEAKFNLTLREVHRFASKLERIRPHLQGELFPLCFCYRARPEVVNAAREAGLHFIGSKGRLEF